MNVDDVLHLLVKSTLDLSAILTNALYIFIIVRKTPKTLSSYSTILLNIACVDFVASCCSLMCIYSLETFSGYMVLVYIGPCTLVNAQLCHLIMAFHADLVGQSVILLMMSFAYRLWVLEISPTDQSHRKGRFWTVAQVMLMTLIILNTIVFNRVGSFDVPMVPGNVTYSAVEISGRNLGTHMISYSFLPLTLLLLICLVGSISIIFIRRRLLSRIGGLRTADRHNHQSIYRSLMAQMTLPIAYVFAFTFFLLDLVGVVHSRTMQRAILGASSLFALLSPLINMHYIPPYRKYLKTIFSGNRVGTKKTSDIALSSEAKF